LNGDPRRRVQAVARKDGVASVEPSADSAHIWCPPDDGTDCQVADNAHFERASISIESLSGIGFDGSFTKIK
jgi:hypothetical protein